MKTFTRVFLNARPEVRCVDGTRPIMYVDLAAGGATNDWVFSFTGGGSIAPVNVANAQNVVDMYADPLERGEMGTAFKPPMKDLGGINNPDTAQNPVFALYNRVRVEKCGYDRCMGQAAYQAGGGFFAGVWPPTGAAINFNVYHQGYDHIAEALAALSAGLTYTTWTVDAAGAVVPATDTLPPLTSASKVLFAGHSGGAHGLYHNIDNLAALVSTYAPNADVRALFDANFLPSNENEAWYDTITPGINDAYDGVWAGQSATAMNTFTYDGAVYWPASLPQALYDRWQADLDQSCLAAHPADGWKCAERYHVLFNHIATPYFFREDFTDPNPEHTAGGAGHRLTWADPGFFAHCAVGVACWPRLDLAEYRQRLTDQFNTLLDGSLLRSELVTGADPSLGAGNYPSMVAWMPDCTKHEGAFDDNSFFGTEIDYVGMTFSMRQFVEQFMLVGRTNLRSWYVDGWADAAGNVQTTVTCPP